MNKKTQKRSYFSQPQSITKSFKIVQICSNHPATGPPKIVQPQCVSPRKCHTSAPLVSRRGAGLPAAFPAGVVGGARVLRTGVMGSANFGAGGVGRRRLVGNGTAAASGAQPGSEGAGNIRMEGKLSRISCYKKGGKNPTPRLEVQASNHAPWHHLHSDFFLSYHAHVMLCS